MTGFGLHFLAWAPASVAQAAPADALSALWTDDVVSLASGEPTRRERPRRSRLLSAMEPIMILPIFDMISAVRG